MSLFRTAILPAAVLAAAFGLQGQTQIRGTVLRGPLAVQGARSARASAPTAGSFGNETRQDLEQDRTVKRQISGTMKPARVPAAQVPTPDGKAVSSRQIMGFDGLSHRDQRLADNGNQFSLEPPDQGFAVSSQWIVEAVNLAIRMRPVSGSLQGTSVASLNQFFGVAPPILRTDPPVYGPFTSDPKVYFDVALQRFFVTTLLIDVNPTTGDFGSHSSVLLAVSKTADPTGAWYFYSLDTTNDGTNGTPKHTACPCFGDQPLIGADANGFYISTNEFPIVGDGFNGAQVYALSKSALAAGLGGPVVAIAAGALEEGISYTLQPAVAPPGGSFESAQGGTEYFLSALEFSGGLDNRIAVWALTNTSSLNTATPNVALQYSVVASEVYGFPPAIQQKDGPTPLRDAIRAGLFGKPSVEQLQLVESNDDRMNQTFYAAGKLWSALNTVVKTKNGTVQTAIAWFAVTPSWTGSVVKGTMANQGYVSVNRASVAYPSVALNAAGKGIMAFTLIGPDYYPSAAYVTLDASGTSDVYVAQAGAGPEDGFTGYLGARVARWGDYSAASVDESGAAWFAVEYIPGGPRTTLANWGTFLGKVVIP